MNVNIQTVHFDADAKLTAHIQKKVEKLTHFHDRITKVDIYLKLDNVVHTIKDKIAEIKVTIPRYEFFVKQTSKSFEESFDTALEAVISQIKRKKERQAAWSRSQNYIFHSRSPTIYVGLFNFWQSIKGWKNLPAKFLY